MKDFETILYETPADNIARIVLNRPETRNSQDTSRGTISDESVYRKGGRR